MTQPEFRMIDTNGVKIRAALQGQGPLVVMVHGFPESWYSWRHQLTAVSAAGTSFKGIWIVTGTTLSHFEASIITG